MKRKITSFMLLLAMLVSIVAVLPVASFAEDTTFKGTDVTLTDGILLNFYVEADDALGIDNAEKDGNYYVLTVDVPAKKMGNDVVAEFKAGADVVGEHSYSVKQYAEGILAGNYDAETKALVSAMLNYGAAAQKYFNYNADELVGTPVTDTAALKAAKAPEVEVDDEAKIFVGASLILEGTMTLRFYFAGSVDSATVDGEDAIVNADAAEYCYVDVKVTPDNIDKAYEVVADDTTVKYSVLNYLQRNADNAALSEMVASIYAYGVAAEAYVLATGCEHEGVEYKVVQLPTVLSEGVKTGHCDACGKDVIASIEKTKAEMNATTSIEYTGFVSDVYSLDDVLSGGKHFYPHEENNYKGRDLYIEFSMLLNDTIRMFDFTNMSFSGIYKTADLRSNQGTPLHWFYTQETGDYNQGGLEISNSKAKEYIYGGECRGKGNDSKGNVTVSGFDGWHRFGIKYHCEAFPGSSAASYVTTVTLYIDGVRVHEYSVNSVDNSNTGSNSLPIIWANKTLDPSQYEDYNSRFVCAYKFNDYLKAEFEGETAYLPIADVYVTAGDSFVIDVSPVENPAAETFTQDGVSLSGKQYFKVN